MGIRTTNLHSGAEPVHRMHFPPAHIVQGVTLLLPIGQLSIKNSLSTV